MPRPEIRRDRSMVPRAIRAMIPALAILIPLSTSPVSAQYEGRTYAITGARLVTVAGPVIENGTIVLRGGLIQALGADLTPPADAVLVDGDSLTVYPGFIDAFSQAGLVLPGGDEREYAGNIADQLANRHFDPDSSGLPAYRKQGLTSALVARSDGVFGGQAVLMNLMGEDIPSMTVRAPVVQTLGYQGQRDYPGTLMAVVAYQRQTLIDAAYHDLLQSRYRQAPRSMVRPPADASLEALIPVAKGEAPVMGIVRIENDFKRLRNTASGTGSPVRRRRFECPTSSGRRAFRCWCPSTFPPSARSPVTSSTGPFGTSPTRRRRSSTTVTGQRSIRIPQRCSKPGFPLPSPQEGCRARTTS
ncbi:MAG: hypothetical protein PVJ04_03485 [Gemmatimonadota bacterium]